MVVAVPTFSVTRQIEGQVGCGRACPSAWGIRERSLYDDGCFVVWLCLATFRGGGRGIPHGFWSRAGYKDE